MTAERRLPRLVALVRDIGFVSLGKYGQYVVTAVTLPLIARLLGTEGLGLLAIGMSAYFVGTLLVSLGIPQFLSAQMPGRDVNQLRGDYLALRLAVLGVIALVMLLGLGLDVDPHLDMLLFGLFCGGVYSLSEDWVLIGQGRFGASSGYQAIGRGAYLLLVVTVLPQRASAAFALLCLLVSSVVTVVLTWYDVERHFGRVSRPREVRQVVRMATPVLTSRLLVLSYGQGSAAIYSSILNASSLGPFSAGDRLVRAVQSMLDPIGFALLPRMSRIRDDHDFWRRTTTGLLACAGVACLATAVVWVTAPVAVRLIYGEDFTAAVPMLRVEALLLPAAALSSFVTTAVLPVRGDTAGVLIGSVVGTCVALVALYVGFRTHSVWALVYGTVASESTVALWYLLRIRRLVLVDRAAAHTTVLDGGARSRGGELT
jgi:O-antigen/teichoic acid export membrane protein